MKWITRENVKVDRVACPWLIRRFVDPQAEFLFVPEEQLLQAARREGAIPFDASRLSEVNSIIGKSAIRLRPSSKITSSLIRRFSVSHLSSGELMSKGQEHVSPESIGLRAIAHGFAATGISDEERLSREFPVYDALYEYVRQELR